MTDPNDRFDALLDLYLPDRETVRSRKADDPPLHKLGPRREDSAPQAGKSPSRGHEGRAKGGAPGDGAGRSENGKAAKAARAVGTREKAASFVLEGRLEYADGRGRVIFGPNAHGFESVPVYSHGPSPCAPGDYVRVRFEGKGRKALRWHIDKLVARSIEPFRLYVHAVNKASGRVFAHATVPAVMPVQDETGFSCSRFVIEAADAELKVGDLVVGRVVGESGIEPEYGRSGKGGWLHVKPMHVHPFASYARHEELVRLNHEAPGDFPQSAQKEARRFAKDLSRDDAAGRLELRGECLVTLDGADARDFDDAVCVKRTPDGGYELIVAIADVSHYVRANSPLDREALKRGNSWYFPTSVAPMLPFELSNELCSLVPHKDRLAVAVRMELDGRGHTKRASFDLAVMRSKARLTYDEALVLVGAGKPDPDGSFAASGGHVPREAVLEKFSPENCEGHDVAAMLEVALELSNILKKRRLERGALDMDLPDWTAAIENDRLVDLAHASHHDMHRLIEEFMIRANEVVADHLAGVDLPFLYRVHDEPGIEKLCSLTEELVDGGLLPQGRLREPLEPRELFALLAKYRGTDRAYPVARACVRSLPLAVYSDENIGHFGLASKAYCHFTSPIRRGADLLVHRVLKTAMGKDQDPILAGRKLKRVAAALSDCERSAQLAEREMARRLAVLWLLNQEKGREYEGLVLSRGSRFAKVQLENLPVEGAFFPPRGRSLPGMGAKLRMALAYLNIVALQADFGPAENHPKKRRDRRARQAAGEA